MKISRLLAIETELLFHEVVDPFRPPYSPDQLSLSRSPFALGPESYTPKVLAIMPQSHLPLLLAFYTFVLFLLSCPPPPRAKIKNTRPRWLYLAPLATPCKR